jgi:hypothetical protein
VLRGLLRVTAFGLSTSLFVACGVPALTTAVAGRHDEVIVATTPSGVSIYDENGKQLALSPAKLTIARKQQPTFYLRKHGFQDTVIVVKRRINPKVSLSIVPAVVIGGMSYQGAPDGQNFLPWFLFATAVNLVPLHLPDYFLGGAWDHDDMIAVSMKKAGPD